jgi:hypothetical protein
MFFHNFLILPKPQNSYLNRKPKCLCDGVWAPSLAVRTPLGFYSLMPACSDTPSHHPDKPKNRHFLDLPSGGAWIYTSPWSSYPDRLHNLTISHLETSSPTNIMLCKTPNLKHYHCNSSTCPQPRRQTESKSFSFSIVTHLVNMFAELLVPRIFSMINCSLSRIE